MSDYDCNCGSCDCGACDSGTSDCGICFSLCNACEAICNCCTGCQGSVGTGVNLYEQRNNEIFSEISNEALFVQPVAVNLNVLNVLI